MSNTPLKQITAPWFKFDVSGRSKCSSVGAGAYIRSEPGLHLMLRSDVTSSIKILFLKLIGGGFVEEVVCGNAFEMCSQKTESPEDIRKVNSP